MTKRRVIFVIPPFDFRDEELFETKDILEKASVEVVIASTIEKKCYGMLRGEVEPNLNYLTIKVDDYDGIVFIGGTGASCFWADAVAHKLAVSFNAANKIVAAICIAPVILANAGILKHKRATVWRSEEYQLDAQGAFLTGRKVEFDGNIITANGPEASNQFARSIVRGLPDI